MSLSTTSLLDRMHYDHVPIPKALTQEVRAHTRRAQWLANAQHSYDMADIARKTGTDEQPDLTTLLPALLAANFTNEYRAESDRQLDTALHDNQEALFTAFLNTVNTDLKRLKTLHDRIRNDTPPTSAALINESEDGLAAWNIISQWTRPIINYRTTSWRDLYRLCKHDSTANPSPLMWLDASYTQCVELGVHSPQGVANTILDPWTALNHGIEPRFATLDEYEQRTLQFNQDSQDPGLL